MAKMQAARSNPNVLDAGSMTLAQLQTRAPTFAVTTDVVHDELMQKHDWYELFLKGTALERRDVNPELTTERLVLRELTVEDAEALFVYRSHPHVTRFQSWQPDSTRTRVPSSQASSSSRPTPAGPGDSSASPYARTAH